MTTTFLVCDLRSGLVLDELPVAADELTCTVAREESQAFTLDVHDPACPDDWAGLVVPGKAMIVALTEAGEPMVAWAVLTADVGAPQVPVNCATLEHCLSRVNVVAAHGDPLEVYDVDEGELMGLLAARMADTHGFVIDAQPTGRRVDAFHTGEEDLSVFTALSDRMAADGGPEWRIRVRWADEDHQHIEKVIEAGPRIGVDRPDAVFERDVDGGGNIESYTRSIDYTSERGATLVVGTSEGAGETRPMSSTYRSSLTTQTYQPWPVWEARPAFSGLDAPEIDDPDAELERLAKATLQRRVTGTRVWTLVGTADAPRPGFDFDGGDTVHVRVTPQGKRDPDGGSFAGRVVGWTWNTRSQAVTPILWEDDEET